MVTVVFAGCAFDTSGLAFGQDATTTPPDGRVVDALAAGDARLADARVIDGPVTMADAMAISDAALPDAALPDAALPDAAQPDATLPDATLPDANQAGSALSFDGTDDFVRVVRQVSGNFTLEAWIRTTASRTGTQHYQGLPVLHADVSGNNDDFGTAILNGHFAFGVGNNDVTIESTTTVTTGAWIHVAATRHRSSGTIRVYINGVEEASATGTNTNLLNDAASIDIGGNNVDNRFFDGDIDEVRIWNTVRTEGQLAANMNVQLTGNESGLVNYWRFDDGSGTSAADSAGVNSGNLGGGAVSSVPTWIVSGAPIF